MNYLVQPSHENQYLGNADFCLIRGCENCKECIQHCGQQCGARCTDNCYGRCYRQIEYRKPINL